MSNDDFMVLMHIGGVSGCVVGIKGWHNETRVSLECKSSTGIETCFYLEECCGSTVGRTSSQEHLPCGSWRKGIHIHYTHVHVAHVWHHHELFAVMMSCTAYIIMRPDKPMLPGQLVSQTATVFRKCTQTVLAFLYLKI